MRKDNTKDRAEFVFDHVFWIVVVMIWFRNLLFRCLEHCSYDQSRLILWGCVILSSVVGMCISM